MALVVDNTPLSATCNSYVGLAEMLSYVSDRVTDPTILVAWNNLPPSSKVAYLVNATRTIDSICEWIGQKYSSAQRLAWPRFNAIVDGYDIPNTLFPESVVEATCEMAIWSMQNNSLISVQQNSAFDSVKVGPIVIDFNENVGGSSEKYSPDIVAMILKDYATINNPHLPGQKTMRVARLHRA